MTTRSEAAVKGWDTRREHEDEEAERLRQEHAAWHAWDKVDTILMRFEAILDEQMKAEDFDGASDRRKRFYAALVGTDKFGYPKADVVMAAIKAVNEG
jgi:hypothetical protein